MMSASRRPIFRCALTLLAACGLAFASFGAANAQGDRVRLGQYISPDFFFAVIYHPVLFENSGIAPHADLDKLEPLLENVEGIEKEDVERIVKILQPHNIFRLLFVVDPQFGDAPDPVKPAVIIQYREKVDGEAMLTELFNGVEGGEHAGKAYFKSTDEKLATKQISGHVAGPRTVIITVESTLHKMLTETDEPRPLVDQMRKVNLKHDVIVHYLSEPLFAVAERQGMSREDLLAMAGDADTQMAQNVRSLYVTIDSTGETMSTIGVTATDEDTAQNMHTMATGGLGQAKAMYQMFSPQLQGMLPPDVVKPLQETATEILDGTEITLSGVEITAKIPLPEALPELAEAAAKFAEQMQAGGGFPGGPGGIPGGGPPGGGFPGQEAPEESPIPEDEEGAVAEEAPEAAPF